MAEILQKELSFKLMGILFAVHSELGNRYQEKYYQRAVEEALKEANISFKKELSVDLVYKGKKIGKYFLDFLIEDVLILELKAIPAFRPVDFKQVLAYLKAKNLPLGILVNFSSDRLTYKRILNSSYTKSA